MTDAALCLIYRDTSGVIRAVVMADAPGALHTAHVARHAGWTCTEHEVEDARTILRAEGTWYTRQLEPDPNTPARSTQPPLF